MSDVGLIVLAPGASTRMGTPKQAMGLLITVRQIDKNHNPKDKNDTA